MIVLTQYTQIKINLPIALMDYVKSKAAKFDIPVTSYVKHLLIKDMEDMEYPVFKMSERSKGKLEKALKDRRKAVNITDVSDFFEKL